MVLNLAAPVNLIIAGQGELFRFMWSVMNVNYFEQRISSNALRKINECN